MINRRKILALGAYGLGALSIPAKAQITSRGFTHNVASGEPGLDSVLLWTRYVPAREDAVTLDVEVSTSENFQPIIAGGSAVARADRDFCAKTIVRSLAANTWYYYRFRTPNGDVSPVGRTRTLPNGSSGRFKLGVFSCSNLAFGWFNAYGHAAGRQDLDLVVHLGDYIYEHATGLYPEPSRAVPGRLVSPTNEIVHLADYRLRYASYRADLDLQALHQRFPMIAGWDDHESANDSWKDGAQNHQPSTEGDWQVRKRVAMQAYREWMPVSDELWKSYDIGDLATLFRLETRLGSRSHQLALGATSGGAENLRGVFSAFREGPWSDDTRTILGSEQERWLANALRRSVRRGSKWQILAQQVIMGSLSLAPEAGAWIEIAPTREVRQRLRLGLAASQAGLPFNMDQWDGYPAARDRLLTGALEADANLIVLSGDSHNAWAFDLDVNGAAAAVDLAVQSVTSPGHEVNLPMVPSNDLAAAMVAHNPQLKWAELARRGYMTLSLTPQRATAEWHFLSNVRQRSLEVAATHTMNVENGARCLT